MGALPRLRIAVALPLLALTIGMLHPVEAQTPGLPDSVHYQQWRFAHGFELQEVPEPSGLCFVPSRNSLFVVDDGAADRPPGVYEVSLEGQVLQKQQIGSDLEGVCYCMADGRLYVADESGERVWVLDPAGLKVEGTFTVSRDFGGQEVLKAGGNGFEGIAYIPDGPRNKRDYFLLLNQDDPSALCRVDRADIKLSPVAVNPAVPGNLSVNGITAAIPLKAFHQLPDLNCGELWYDQARQQLWVVHSWLNIYEVLDIDTLAQLDGEVCPGVAQEGVCQDAQGRLWIGSDSGGLAVYERQPQLVDSA